MLLRGLAVSKTASPLEGDKPQERMSFGRSINDIGKGGQSRKTQSSPARKAESSHAHDSGSVEVSSKPFG